MHGSCAGCMRVPPHEHWSSIVLQYLTLMATHTHTHTITHATTRAISERAFAPESSVEPILLSLATRWIKSLQVDSSDSMVTRSKALGSKSNVRVRASLVSIHCISSSTCGVVCRLCQSADLSQSDFHGNWSCCSISSATLFQPRDAGKWDVNTCHARGHPCV